MVSMKSRACATPAPSWYRQQSIPANDMRHGGPQFVPELAWRALLVFRECHSLIVHLHLEPIADGFLRRKFQPEIYRLRFRGVVAEGIVSGEIHRVRAVP